MVADRNAALIPEVSRVPIGIARRHGCNASRIRGNPSVTVAYTLSLVNGAHLQDPPHQAGDGVLQQSSTAGDLFTSSAFSLTVGDAEEDGGGFGAL